MKLLRLSLYVLILTLGFLLPSATSQPPFDTYGGYRPIQSRAQRFYTGTSSHIDAHRLVDAQANFPPNGLVGFYLHPTDNQPFVPMTPQSTYRQVLRYRIVKNTRTEIFTAPSDGDLTTYARSGDAYKTSGFFTVEKIGSRWWYMTPEGHAFITLSVSVLTPKGNDGHGPSGKTHGDHIQAKYGGPAHYLGNWANATIARLRRWGFNTIGTFSHHIQTQPYLTHRMPYVMTLRLSNKAVLAKEVGNVWEGIGGGKFPDLWHPNFLPAIDRRMQQRATPEMVRDPYIVYLFPDQADELRGISQHHPSLAWAAWVGKPVIGGHTNYTKRALRDVLRAQYGAIHRLNIAWGTAYTTWESDGGYDTGRGFLDQGKTGAPGPKRPALKTRSQALQADMAAFEHHLFERYAKLITATIRKYAPHHLIITPNALSTQAAVEAFDGYFDVFWARDRWVYDTLTQKRPLGASAMSYLTAERDSPLRLEGWLAPQFEVQSASTSRGRRQRLKVWHAAPLPNPHAQFHFQGGHPLHIALFDEDQRMLNMGVSPGNVYDMLQTGTDHRGYWMQLRSRGYRSGSLGALAQRLVGQVADCQPTGPRQRAQTAPQPRRVQSLNTWSAPTFCQARAQGAPPQRTYYRRRGLGSPAHHGFRTGYGRQEDRAQAWHDGLYQGLMEPAANGDYFRIGANWWKFSDNGSTFWRERYNFGLVTIRDNAYDGREATTRGADGLPGTADDEAHDYGDLLTGVTRANTGLYEALQQLK
ncbi:hypothetical protein [Candidatus Entotheonella palauensis]|uniref:hypothetical protein n=1 Tax=Candidatus Entotheonella palauensis TaxID=93172 RepID=UPI000B7EF1BD|nr:hypothetical protein [Candidatus Entotheonella palauensis]